jgi:hypothetical protein
MWDTSNNPGGPADRFVLLQDAPILHRHLPAGEIHQSPSVGDMKVVKRRTPWGLHHTAMRPNDLGRRKKDSLDQRRGSGKSKTPGKSCRFAGGHA